MARFGLCGPSYASQAVSADAQMTMNLYFEPDESGQGKSPGALLATEGSVLFAALSGASVRALFNASGRLFAICGTSLVEVFADGTKTVRGAVAADTKPATVCANTASPQQLFITSGGAAYCYNTGTNTLTTIDTSGGPALQGPVAMGDFSDGFFFALLQDGRFQISAIEDGTTWNPLDIAKVSTYADNTISMKVDHREIWFFGPKATDVYYNSGATAFPFEPIPGNFIEQGIGAPFARSQVDNTMFWLGQDERGAAIAWRANGPVPTRISTHAIEYAWQGYSTTADAVSYSYQAQGHTFWVVYFPTANATWVYDASTGQWHQRGFWETGSGTFSAHRSQCHAYCFGKHLVGDWNSGNIYQLNPPTLNTTSTSWTFGDDNGNPIRRLRRAPYISSSAEWMSFPRLRVMMDAGLGPIPPLAGAHVPGFLGPQSIVLVDANNVAWTVTITDDGHFGITQAGSGPGQAILINGDDATTWLLGVDISGALTITQMALDTTQQQMFPMLTDSGFQSGITITSDHLAVPITPGSRGPQMMLRWSNDNANTWSNYYAVDCGQAGQYGTVPTWRRLGRARGIIGRVFEISMTDAVGWRITDADVDAMPDWGPTERLTDKLKKMA